MTQLDENELLSVAAACAKERDFEQAIGQLKRLTEGNPKHEIATGMLAAIYAELQMTDRAIECYRRVLAINPVNPLARLQLGLLQMSVDRAQDALDTWKPGLDEPNEFLTHFHYGIALLQLHRPAEARSMLARAARHMPPDHELGARLQELLKRLEQ